MANEPHRPRRASYNPKYEGVHALKTKEGFAIRNVLGIAASGIGPHRRLLYSSSISGAKCPATHLEMEMPLHDSLGMRVAVIAYLGLLAVGNLGLMTIVWRAFKELKTAE